MKKIARLLTRMFPPMLACACGSLATLLFIRLGVAHAAAHLADPVVGAATLPIAGIDWAFWIAIVSALGTAASVVLHRIALKTHSAKVDALAVDIDTLRGLLPPPAPQLSIAKAPGSGAAGMLAILLFGALAAPALTACTSAQLSGVASGAEGAVVNCTGQQLGTTPGLTVATLTAIANDVVALHTKCTTNGSIDWTCVEQAAEQEGEVIGGCALVQVVAGTAPSSGGSTAPVKVAAASTPSPGLAAIATFRAKLAPGATFHTAAGNF